MGKIGQKMGNSGIFELEFETKNIVIFEISTLDLV